MKKYIIIPDVTCDMSEELRSYFGLEDYLEGYVHINDKSLHTRLDWKEISKDEFYRILSNKKDKVTSAAASPEEYYLKFKEYAERGIDIISMSISSKISVTYNISVSAAQRIKEEYPEINIYCVDTLRMSGSFGLIVAYALELQKAGKSFDEVIEWVENNKCRIHQMGPIDDLTFIARRGKISNGKAIMGNLVGIKPMGDSNAEGYVTVLAKVKGIKKALDVTVSYIKHVATNIEDQYIFIMHSDREEQALLLKQKIEASFTCKKVFVSDVFSACGTNIGPGMISAYFLGEPIINDSTNEKEKLNLAVSENSK